MSIARRYTRQEIERQADEVRRRCVKALGLYRLPLPIPVDLWVEHPLGIRLEIESLRPLWDVVGHVVLGEAQPRRRAMRVHDEFPKEHQFRFTVAHELGHILLHAEDDVLYRERSGEPRGREAKEVEADHFACAVLMPVELVIREVFAACVSPGQGRQGREGKERKEGRIDPLQLVGADARVGSTEVRHWRRRVLPRLAERFGVSRRVAIRRLAQVDRETAAPFVPTGLTRRLLNPKA
jgi:hypothetical protein